MTYKVIKPFPGYNEGDEITDDVINVGYRTFNPKDFPEFLQLIEEKPKTVWDLKYGDKYYGISQSCGINEIIYRDSIVDDGILIIGNGFLNPEEAEKELEKRKLITKLLRSKHEMGLNKAFVRDDNNYFVKEGNSSIYMIFSRSDIMPLLGYFSKESQEYIDNNKIDLLRLFELTK